MSLFLERLQKICVSLLSQIFDFLRLHVWSFGYFGIAKAITVD